MEKKLLLEKFILREEQNTGTLGCCECCCTDGCPQFIYSVEALPLRCVPREREIVIVKYVYSCVCTGIQYFAWLKAH